MPAVRSAIGPMNVPRVAAPSSRQTPRMGTVRRFSGRHLRGLKRVEHMLSMVERRGGTVHHLVRSRA